MCGPSHLQVIPFPCHFVINELTSEGHKNKNKIKPRKNTINVCVVVM